MSPTRRSPVPALALVCALLAAAPASAENTASLRLVVRDPQGGVIPAAAVSLLQQGTDDRHEAVTDAEGAVSVSHLPAGIYALRVAFPGFDPDDRRLDLRPGTLADLDVVLSPAAARAEVSVSPAADTSWSAGTRHAARKEDIERTPTAVGSRGLESILVSFPGFAQNANGAIHPRGAHNQMTYVIDGFPVSDQLTGAFANALDAGIVDRVELMTGNIPADHGSKVSGVAVVNSRSGLGVGRRVAGDVLLARAGFDTWQAGIQAGGERGRAGYFGSVTAMATDRFLDQVSLENLHNRGAFGRGFGRVDVRLSDLDFLRFNAMGGQSSFEVANLPSQHAAGQDQRQRLADAAGWGSYLRALGAGGALEATAGYRTSTAQLLGSPGDSPVTATQDRRLSTAFSSARYSRSGSTHDWRAGVEWQRFPVREHFTVGITSPEFNDPASPKFNPALLAHDLSRGGLPFVFDDARSGWMASAFTQSTVRWGAAVVTAGLRFDEYRFLVVGRQLQPRVGAAYRLPGEWGVLRASYNRNYQTPPNENLLLSSSPEAAALAPASVSRALGGAYRLMAPERQLVYEAGYERGLGRIARLDLSVYRKNSRDQQDNNNFFDTGIIFPTTLAAIRVTGAEARLTLRERGGVTGTLSATTSRAISSPPFTGGLFLGQDAVDLLSAGPFPIDHDQRLAVHGTMQYNPPGPLWLSTSIRYDSGLVSNPSEPAEVAADPDFADLLPYVDLTARVPRVRPRTIVDVAAGFELTSAAGRRTWSVQAQVTNLTDQTALYNFQSVFVGTRVVQPRTLAVRLRRYF